MTTPLGKAHDDAIARVIGCKQNSSGSQPVVREFLGSKHSSRSDRCTHPFILRKIIEEPNEMQSTLIVTFVDFQKFFFIASTSCYSGRFLTFMVFQQST